MSIVSDTICILVDADACPVKAEIYRVAERHDLRVIIVANSFIPIPRDQQKVERIIVSDKLDAADDWIAENSRPGAIVITADIPLASRALEKGASVIAPNGRLHTQNTIGNTLATRNLMDSLRSAGETTRGPAPFSPKDRSAFLSALDLAIVRLKRDGFKSG
ncbi:YaiI/YqxD family protein [Brucellaceae bacterium D45D]